ncbi:TetR family transcriptional regulator [Streptomyces spiroverticillatus]|uniref:TetR family transcriptional regulator n=1 Tax=Streptomyces finlayi TaxID=67296 RepID=A0A918X5G5_9ACTN|nr:helix-turn-helix domain-containing protein [Streptomyces finlayi]GHA49305.1 TetR family transcriptional regulator [Streptomyces spiroverticillatus]GHD13631.1 TetR family transcriptional regulator [Streptomyces finlayi]
MVADQTPQRTTPRRAPADSSPGRISRRPRDPAIEEVIIRAACKRLASDGYSSMTIGDVAADAGVTRPTLHRRWANKRELVLDTIEYVLRVRREDHPPLRWDRLPPHETFTEAVRRLGLYQCGSCATTLHGSCMCEAEREPDLSRHLRDHVLKPCLEELLATLISLQRSGAVREDADLETVTRLCLGSYCATYLRTGRRPLADHATQVAGALWPAIAALPCDGPAAAAPAAPSSPR